MGPGEQQTSAKPHRGISRVPSFTGGDSGDKEGGLNMEDDVESSGESLAFALTKAGASQSESPGRVPSRQFRTLFLG